MFIGEDIPMLIPMSIAFVIFFIFLISFFGDLENNYETMEFIELDNLMKMKIMQTYGDEFGNLNLTCTKCKSLETLNITAKYSVKVEIVNSTEKKCCFSNFKKMDEIKLVFEHPVTINNKFYKLVISVGK